MISSDDLKEGTYLHTINNHGRIVLKIIKYLHIDGRPSHAYECEVIEGKLNINEFNNHLKSYIFGEASLLTMEIAHDYTREEKLKKLGL